ncbi:hypothetical protein IEQ34_000389 [Dendrobium chrysotoxum]|uniref:Uncharacterized protein n=1 Tax=Dendrobium chrysotoxum TaxID=161865 RepID=A0AAV7HNY7_DENCH|nr:hypothetical protein IEQ34_000389 [Dendrobium chrysotoxum]
MTCKRHPYEVGVGVCATCLRERLWALIAAQNKLASAAGDAQTYPTPRNPHLSFPRSASPYFAHRRSVGSDGTAINRFFTTPPAGNISRRKPHSFWSSVFGPPRSESSEPRSSFSWISTLIRRKKSRKLFEAAGSPPPLERGMSLARCRDEDDGADSDYSSDSSTVGRLPGPTPIRPQAARPHRTGDGGGRGFSGFVVCLSPLVRSNHNRRRAEPVNDQIRRHVSFGDNRSVAVNRSRKLADFGRFK